MEIADKHKSSKGNAYWSNLTSGSTGKYKEQQMDILIKKYLAIKCQSILDVGVGTSDAFIRYAKGLGAGRLVAMDYDEKIITQMKTDHKEKTIEWRVADIYNISHWKDRFDLVLIMDVLHEIYSFYGRPYKNIDRKVEHKKGQKKVVEALANIARLVNKNGGIIITDGVLPSENHQVIVQLNHDKIIQAIQFFLSHYKTKKIEAKFLSKNTLSINSRDLISLLSQYNKIKNEDWERWNIERLEVHEYMTYEDFEKMFTDLGFSMNAIVGTPPEYKEEWEHDFTVLEGMSSLPDKRITLLAIKK